MTRPAFLVVLLAGAGAAQPSAEERILMGSMACQYALMNGPDRIVDLGVEEMGDGVYLSLDGSLEIVLRGDHRHQICSFRPLDDAALDVAEVTETMARGIGLRQVEELVWFGCDDRRSLTLTGREEPGWTYDLVEEDVACDG